MMKLSVAGEGTALVMNRQEKRQTIAIDMDLKCYVSTCSVLQGRGLQYAGGRDSPGDEDAK